MRGEPIHMIRNRSLTLLFAGSALWLAGCAVADNTDDEIANEPREAALQVLRDRAGAAVTLDINELGTTRVVAMTPQAPVPMHASDPLAAATEFLTANHDVFDLDAADAANFVVAGLDVETKLGISHVTLQRVFSGIPVFQGAITVHLDAANGVFHAVGDEFYRVD